ncbi:MAG: BrnT family toxin [Proteobacteria bacterium]|nr:BrnT family toxin [Pseudomonadota bacterium]
MPDSGLRGEERFVVVGADALGRILVVSYTYRRHKIRIISARRAVQSERKEHGKRTRLQLKSTRQIREAIRERNKCSGPGSRSRKTAPNV